MGLAEGDALTDTVSFMNDEDARVPRLTRASIQKQIDEEIGFLADNMAKGIEDYRHRTGKIEGLRMALHICQEVEKKIGG